MTNKHSRRNITIIFNPYITSYSKMFPVSYNSGFTVNTMMACANMATTFIYDKLNGFFKPINKFLFIIITINFPSIKLGLGHFIFFFNRMFSTNIHCAKPNQFFWRGSPSHSISTQFLFCFIGKMTTFGWAHIISIVKYPAQDEAYEETSCFNGWTDRMCLTF